MARLTMVLALALAVAACAMGGVQAAAARGRLPVDHPLLPKPIQPAEPCDVKRLPCVPVYSEEGARRLADLGIMDQVAVREELPPPPPAPTKRKSPCRRRGDCRRKTKSQPRAAPRKGHSGRHQP